MCAVSAAARKGGGLMFGFGKRKPAKRAAVTDALVRAVQAAQTGAGLTEPGGAGLQIAATIWAGALGGAEVRGANMPHDFMANLARRLVIHGEALFLIRQNRRLVPIAHWDVQGEEEVSTWRFRVDVATPSGNRTYKAKREEVLLFHWSTDAARPWKGIGPATLALQGASIAGNSERALGQDLNASSAYVIPVPANADDDETYDGDGNEVDANAELMQDIAGAKGKTSLVESTAEGWSGSGERPQHDWKQRRLGPEPDPNLINLAKWSSQQVIEVCGIPPGLSTDSSDGGAQRESWRRFLHGSVAPMAKRIEAELTEGLEAKIVIDLSNLHASDITGRARAFQSLVGGGMDIAKAAGISGIVVDDE